MWHIICRVISSINLLFRWLCFWTSVMHFNKTLRSFSRSFNNLWPVVLFFLLKALIYVVSKDLSWPSELIINLTFSLLDRRWSVKKLSENLISTYKELFPNNLLKEGNVWNNLWNFLLTTFSIFVVDYWNRWNFKKAYQ